MPGFVLWVIRVFYDCFGFVETLLSRRMQLFGRMASVRHRKQTASRHCLTAAGFQPRRPTLQRHLSSNRSMYSRCCQGFHSRHQLEGSMSHENEGTSGAHAGLSSFFSHLAQIKHNLSTDNGKPALETRFSQKTKSIRLLATTDG